MLTLGDRLFTSGRCRFLDSDGIRDEPKIYTRIIPGDWETPILAQLDTGAAWSVLDTEIAEELGLFDELGEDTKLSTMAGAMEGVLVRTPVTCFMDGLLAHWGGDQRIDFTGPEHGHRTFQVRHRSLGGFFAGTSGADMAWLGNL